MDNVETRQIRQVFEGMKNAGFTDWDTVSDVVFKFQNAGRLIEEDEIVRTLQLIE